jgi:hypothetical protein
MTNLAVQEMLEHDKEERRMRYMQNMASTVSYAAMMNMMQRSMESKQPIGADPYSIQKINQVTEAA